MVAKVVVLLTMLTKSYVVHHGSVDVDGVLDDPAWRDAEVATDFSFPWQDRASPPTEFRAIADDVRLYFAFRVDDDDVVVDRGEGEEAVARGDRVELFFTPSASLEEYLCFEIDPDGRVLDYRAAFYRDFDFEWDSSGLDVGAARTDFGYVVEGSFPLELLPLSPEGAVLTGIFRAEYSRAPNDSPTAEWISWVPPETDEPDFHVPTAFGVFYTR